MQIRVIGDERDTIGFGLAGIESTECRTRADVSSALQRCAADPEIGILVITGAVAALAPDEIARQQRAVDGPILVVLG